MSLKELEFILVNSNLIENIYPQQIKELISLLNDEYQLTALVSQSKKSDNDIKVQTSSCNKDLYHFVADKKQLQNDIINDIKELNYTILKLSRLKGLLLRLELDQQRIIELYCKQRKVIDICNILHISRPSYYRLLKEALTNLLNLYLHNEKE